MRLTDAVQDYINCIIHERGLAKKTTVTGYASYLRIFLAWMQQNGYEEPTLDDFNVPVLRRYQYFLSGMGLRPRSIRGRFHPIVGLGEFLVKNGALEMNPAKVLTLPKKDAARRLLVTDEEVLLLLQACERQRNPRQIALSRAMLSVLIFAGLRREELLSLRVNDINFTDGSILVRSGKGSKSRTVYTCEPCMTALKEWIAFRPKNCKHDYLWARDKSRRMYEYGLNATLETVKATAGLADHDNIKPHSLRHNFATRLMNNGAPIKSIQAALGHAHMTTTAIYLHLSEQEAKQVAHLTALTPLQPKSQDDPKIIRLPQGRDQRERIRRRIARQG